MRKLLLVITAFAVAANLFAADIQFLTHSAEEQTKLDEKGELRGIPHAGKRAFYVEVVREMMKLMKVPEIINAIPIKRGMMLVQDDINYAMFNVSRIPEREGTVKWVGPFEREADYFYEMKNSPTGAKTLEDAKKVKSIAVVSGGVHEALLLKNGFTNLSAVRTYDICFQMLKQGRVNLTASASSTVSEKLAQAGIPPAEILQTPVLLVESGGYIAFSRNIPDEGIRLWQDAFDRVKKSGRFQQLYNEYLLPAEK